jgi:hypothetical protein
VGREVQRTADGRFLVVEGRRWRTADPNLPEDVRERLPHHLGVGRSGVRSARRAGDDDAVAAARATVQLAKTGLGERGPAWWEQDDDERRDRWEAALRELEGCPAGGPGSEVPGRSARSSSD